MHSLVPAEEVWVLLQQQSGLTWETACSLLPHMRETTTSVAVTGAEELIRTGRGLFKMYEHCGKKRSAGSLPTPQGQKQQVLAHSPASLGCCPSQSLDT